MKKWRCFHCDEVFEDRGEAALHFGETTDAPPACQMRTAGERALLVVLRNAEAELSRYRAEDSDVLRAMHATAADHAAEVRRVEELGYARGLQDAQGGLVKVLRELNSLPAGAKSVRHPSHATWKRLTEELARY